MFRVEEKGERERENYDFKFVCHSRYSGNCGVKTMSTLTVYDWFSYNKAYQQRYTE